MGGTFIFPIKDSIFYSASIPTLLYGMESHKLIFVYPILRCSRTYIKVPLYFFSIPNTHCLGQINKWTTLSSNEAASTKLSTNFAVEKKREPAILKMTSPAYMQAMCFSKVAVIFGLASYIAVNGGGGVGAECCVGLGKKLASLKKIAKS